MTSISAKVQTSPLLEPIVTAGAPQYLSMDAILFYCESRLRGLDTQVQEHFSRQKKANTDSAALSQLLSCLGACPNGFGADGRAAHDLIRAYQAAITTVGADSVIGQKLIAAQDAFVNAASKGGAGGELARKVGEGDFWTKDLAANADAGLVNPLSMETMKGFCSSIENLQKEINSGAELGMITLQSLMSERQMAVQIATNLLQSLGDQLNKVAANIGR